MTNEEAIEYIHDMRCDIRDNSNYSITDKENTALNMAIAALKAEPCEDAVSLDGVIDTIEWYRTNPQHFTEDNLIEDIKGLPPVSPKPRWIPVDYDRYPETYPKAFQEVWITDAYGEVYHKAYDGTRSIKAWMSYIIPEPYKEGESE